MATTDGSRRVSWGIERLLQTRVRVQLSAIRPSFYTPLHTAGDLVGLLDALNASSAVIVGHDWGATHAWNAAMIRPDRFNAVFCLSVPYFPRSDVSVFERMRTTGHENNFYMFEQIKPEADQIWADAAVTIPGILSGHRAPLRPTRGENPLDTAHSLHRAAPEPLPLWAEPDYVTHNIAEFQRTGFHGALNYYRAAESYFSLFAAWKGAKITQPSFTSGKADGLGRSIPLPKNCTPAFPASLEPRTRQCGSLDTARGLRRGIFVLASH